MLTCLKTVFQRITISRTMRLKTKYVRLQVTGQCTTPDKWRQKLTSRLTIYVLLIKLVK